MVKFMMSVKINKKNRRGFQNNKRTTGKKWRFFICFLSDG